MFDRIMSFNDVDILVYHDTRIHNIEQYWTILRILMDSKGR